MRRLGISGAPELTLDTSDGALVLYPPTKADVSEFLRIKAGKDLKDLLPLFARLLSENKAGETITAEQLDDWGVEDLSYFTENYTAFIRAIKNSPAVQLPYYPTENKGEQTVTVWEKLVADYMRIDLYSVEKMDYYEYLVIRRDAFISALEKTSAGQEYLENAYRLTQTEPDRASLRAAFGR